MTTWPVAPPSPDPESEMMDRSDWEWHPRDIGSVTTSSRGLSQSILGEGTEKLAVGGMILCSRMRQAFNRETRKAAASRWLRIQKVGGQHMGRHLGNIPKVSFDAPDRHISVSGEDFAGSICLDAIANRGPWCWQSSDGSERDRHTNLSCATLRSRLRRYSSQRAHRPSGCILSGQLHSVH